MQPKATKHLSDGNQSFQTGVLGFSLFMNIWLHSGALPPAPRNLQSETHRQVSVFRHCDNVSRVSHPWSRKFSDRCSKEVSWKIWMFVLLGQLSFLPYLLGKFLFSLETPLRGSFGCSGVCGRPCSMESLQTAEVKAEHHSEPPITRCRLFWQTNSQQHVHPPFLSMF